MFRHTPLTLFFLTFIFLSPVMGTKESDDDSFHSAQSCDDIPTDEVRITLPHVAQLEVAQDATPSNCKYNALFAGCAGGLCLIFGTIIALPIILTNIPVQICPDICRNEPGYYAPIKGGPNNESYLWVYCNGTTDGEPKKRGIVTPRFAPLYLSKRKPSIVRKTYKDGKICEEAAVADISEYMKTVMEIISTSTAASHETLPPLVELNETTE